MSQIPPHDPKPPLAGNKADIGAATARLFFEMSTTMPDADLRQAVATMNERMASKRQFESVMTSDRLDNSITPESTMALVARAGFEPAAFRL